MNPNGQTYVFDTILQVLEKLGNHGRNGRLPFVQTPNLIYKILFYNDAHRTLMQHKLC